MKKAHEVMLRKFEHRINKEPCLPAHSVMENTDTCTQKKKKKKHFGKQMETTQMKKKKKSKGYLFRACCSVRVSNHH